MVVFAGNLATNWLQRGSVLKISRAAKRLDPTIRFAKAAAANCLMIRMLGRQRCLCCKLGG
jgi:hypothetical protein